MKKITETGHLYTFFGIGRSGNHAVIDWVYKRLSGSKVFFNNVSDLHPLEQREMFYIQEDKFFNEENKLANQIKKYVNEKDAVATHKNRLDLLVEDGWVKDPGNLVLPEHTDNLVISFEDVDPIKQSEFVHRAETEITKHSEHKIALVLLRNPFNLIASRALLVHRRSLSDGIKKKPTDLEKIIELWKVYAGLVLENKQIDGYNKTIYIKYEDWFSSEPCRVELLNDLDIGSSNYDLDQKVNIFGGGSSFDGLNRGLKANKLNVRDRWKQLLLSNDNGLKLVADECGKLFKQHREVLELSKQIFDE